MTDIQRIAWENGWHILFHGATVRQERNDHDLMRDFADEIPGYLHNYRIRKTLEDLPLRGGKPEIMNNIRACYAALVKLEVVASGELPLVEGLGGGPGRSSRCALMQASQLTRVGKAECSKIPGTRFKP
jgi:hypothetical protein